MLGHAPAAAAVPGRPGEPPRGLSFPRTCSRGARWSRGRGRRAMKPIAYVSDESFGALAGAWVDLSGGPPLRSGASGAVWADMPDGEDEAVVAEAGYGRKRTRVIVGERPHPLR